MHTSMTEKDRRTFAVAGDLMVSAFNAVPLTSEEQEAMDWMDEIFATDLNARIGRMRWTDDASGAPTGQPVWTFKYDGDRNWFVGHEGETLRALILSAYRTSQTCAGCGNPLVGNNGEDHRCMAE